MILCLCVGRMQLSVATRCLVILGAINRCCGWANDVSHSRKTCVSVWSVVSADTMASDASRPCPSGDLRRWVHVRDGEMDTPVKKTKRNLLLDVSKPHLGVYQRPETGQEHRALPRQRQVSLQLEAVNGLPGIVIPYPLSRLMLDGHLSTHIIPVTTCRGYCSLQRRGWLWLIESHATSRKTSSRNMYDPRQIVPPERFGSFPARPEKLQVVGVVKFGETVTYRSKAEFDVDVHSHFVPVDHASAWCEPMSIRIGWRIGAVCSLLEPVPFCGCLCWGFHDLRTFQVKFAAEADRHCDVGDVFEAKDDVCFLHIKDGLVVISNMY